MGGMKKFLMIRSRIVILLSACMSIVVGLADARTINEVFPPVFNLTSLNGNNGFAINGTSEGSLGFSVKGAGDINGDGIPDMLFFALDGNYINKVYVVFGSNEGWPESISLGFLNGSNGFVVDAGEGFLAVLACGIGDVNNDGIDDILVGDSWGNLQAGRCYVLFGSKGPWAAEVHVDDLDGTNGFVINGIKPSSFSGSFISGVGDVNGDKIPDILIGTGLRWVENVMNQVYVVFGREGLWSPEMNLDELDGRNGCIINGASKSGAYSISGVGDVNGDGLDDIGIGDPMANNATGRSYVLFGRKGPWPAVINLGSLDGTNGFAMNGVNLNDESGGVVSGVGDVNGDGLDDVLIAALWANHYGQIYVVYGNPGPWSAAINLGDLNGTNGFMINGISYSGGYTISGVGDVNKDGLDDVIIGASWVNQEIGQSFIVLGNKGPREAAFNLTSLNGSNGFMINGINLGDWSGDSVSAVGDVNADGIDDIGIGASRANDASGQGYILFGEET